MIFYYFIVVIQAHVGSQNRPRVFSPRMDYDEWTPLGRGNPLRNDPTYDYVPPVLDRVHYWLDSQTTEPSPKRDILLLGATAKKTSPKLPDHYPNYTNRQKFPTNQENQPEPVKLRTTSFRNDVSDYRNPNRMPSVPGSYYPNSYYGQQSKPYTMMLPPPLLANPLNDHQHLIYDHSSKDRGYQDSYQFSTQTEKGLISSDQQLYDYPPKSYQQPHLSPQSPRVPYPQVTAKPKVTLVAHIETLKSHSPSSGSQNPRHETTTSTVSFEKSDLVYQSSQTLSSGWLTNDRGPSIKTPSNDRESYYQDFDHQASGSSNHDVVIGQNANIIVQGESCGNDEVVVGHKEEAPSVPSVQSSNDPESGASVIAHTEDDNKDTGELGSASSMHIVLANSPPPATTDGPVTIVMPANYSAKKDEIVTRKEEGFQAPISLQQTMALGTDEAGQDGNTFANATSPPSMPVHPEGLPSSSTMRNLLAHHQAQTHFPPSAVLGPSPNQHIVHQPIAQVRPVPGMMHMGPNLHTGMVMGLRPPAPPVIGHAQANMADLFRGQPVGGVMSMEEQNLSRRPYQHRITQPSGLTMTSAGPLWTMASGGVNVEDQRLGQTGQVPSESVQTGQGPSEEVYTTFGPILTGTRVHDSVTGVEDSKAMDKIQSQLAILLRNEDTKGKVTNSATTATTSSPLPVTTVSSLTTDQIFSHYKQPVKPIRGPMYLIIQGHSKVKTYKPTAENHLNSIRGNEILDSTTSKPISDFDKFVNDNTKRMAEKLVTTKRTEEKRQDEHTSEQDSLLSLLESGFSSFTMPVLSDLEEENSNSTVK